MNPEYIVSEMVNSDVLEVLNIGIGAHLNTWTEGDYINGIKADGSVYLVVRGLSRTLDLGFNGFVIGRIVDKTPNDCIAEIYNIAIMESYRGRGLATLLLKRWVDIVVSKGVTEVWLEVRSSNQPAIALYEKSGFQVKSKRKSYYVRPVEDAVIMSLNPQ